MTEKLQVKLSAHTALITINNPPANTWDLESLDQLYRTVTSLNQNSQIQSLIITGQGKKFFSAGANLKMFASANPSNAQEITDSFGKAFEALSNFKGVSIAAINGIAMGGGLECALACDIRIGEAHCSLGLPEAKVGLLPCAGGTQRLLSLAGEGWVKRLILCGETLVADKALELGIIEEIVEPGNSLQRAFQFADQVAEQSPTSIALCKELIQQSRTILTPGLNMEREYFVKLFSTKDQKEGIQAFLEKRKPEWKNA
ncbi:enoyl-CoA hydratase [Neptuniibacter sp.]|uniref:enoyl-CoA hydratase n=1 Tax=Neptuniibacter sp. TaxID=1962643 RepID=UPI0026308D7B|nr:enoyl-CoA hydratase [Neptuniibacter sp.]MCP4595364.1 enoyl-CoA hydratase [Neptuniibacter sp.]